MVDIKFMGITRNEINIIGRVIEPPKFVPYGEGECAILKVKTVVRNLSNSGQWVDETEIVPITVIQLKQVETVKSYVKEGRQLSINAYYKSWEKDGVPQHAVISKNIQLGDKPYEGPEASSAPASGDGLPPY